MKTKYPGSNILYEYGTLKELASSWGVSERTISRWKNKAMAETGMKPKSKKPKLSTIAKFKGTRKELAKKYNISERTAYRWLNKAREKGLEVEDRKNKNKYPGVSILYEYGTLKELASIYGVSERTISRWKARAKAEQEPEAPIIETFETPEIEEPKITEEDYQEQINDFLESISPLTQEEYDEEIKDYSEQIIDILTSKGVISEDSLFYDLSPEDKNEYIQAYIDFKNTDNPRTFYNPETGETDLSPDFVTNVNIWGDEFEQWLADQIQAQAYEL